MSKITSLIKPSNDVHINAILALISNFVTKHGNVALSCGGEWLYQDDDGQVDSMELVSDILDALSDFAEDGSDE